MRPRRATHCLVLAAVAGLAAACKAKGKGPFHDEFMSFEEATGRAPSVEKRPGTVNRYVSVTADRGSTGALGFSRVPLDLWPPFDLSARFGVYRLDRAAGIGEGIFGIELDARGTQPLEFYGVYAQSLQGGLNVFVSKRGAADAGAVNVGQRFFAGATLVDVFLAHDGASLVVSARDGGTADAPAVVAAVPFTVTVPLNPGFGVFNVSDRADIGFDRFELGAFGDPPAPVSPAHAATASLCAAFFRLLSAHNRLDGTETPDLPGADLALGEVAEHLDTARQRIESIPDAAKRRSAKSKALGRIAAAQESVAKVRAQLESKGAAKVASVLAQIQGGLGWNVVRAADAILPDDLRASLPGEKP